MKKHIAILAVVTMAAISQAAVTINFSTTGGSILNEGGTALAQHETFLVFWSSDQSTSGFNAANPTSPTGGDVLLGAFDTTGGATVSGRITGHTAESFGTGTAAYSPGYVYIAVFETPFASYAGTIAGGTQYGLGPIYTQSLAQQNPNPTTVDNYGALITSGSPISTTQVVAVPEPASLALLGIGLALIGLRRRMMK